ncbi:MAG: phage terminase large subunit [Planctomycetes bacterium]|nr:phage terminase large subunit [Planctomycetota bacterium]
MIKRLDYRAALQAELIETRRSICRPSLLAFANTYLKGHFRLKPSPMHAELAAQLETVTLTARGARIATAAPRGHAKTTLVGLAFPLWCSAFEHEAVIYLISDTIDQAAGHLGNIKAELASNELLRCDFPDLCEPLGGKPRSKRWQRSEIVTRNGIKIVALGAQSKIRGRKHGSERPSLIINDDLENDEGADSPERCEKLLNWLNQVVLNAGTRRTNVVVTGTILSYGAVLETLMKSPGWSSKKYRAVESWSDALKPWERWNNIYNGDEEFECQTGPEAARAFLAANESVMLKGTRVLWPELESYQDLMTARLIQGEYSFDAEKQNEPANPRNTIFKPEDFRYWDEQYESEEALIAAVGERGIFIGALDPSLGKPGRNRDFTAIITLLVDPKNGIKYVLDADITKRQNDEIIRAVIDHHRRRGYQAFAAETVQFQEYLADQLIKQSRLAGFPVPVKPTKPHSDKFGRIQALQPAVHNGEIRFSKQHWSLLQQMKQFPKAAHDDGPDALEMAVKLARGRRRRRLRFGHLQPIAPGSVSSILVMHD